MKINGLKIRSREKRGMGSNPIIGTYENAILPWKIAKNSNRQSHVLLRCKIT